VLKALENETISNKERGKKRMTDNIQKVQLEKDFEVLDENGKRLGKFRLVPSFSGDKFPTVFVKRVDCYHPTVESLLEGVFCKVCGLNLTNEAWKYNHRNVSSDSSFCSK
jgi:hypothetical protein